MSANLGLRTRQGRFCTPETSGLVTCNARRDPFHFQVTSNGGPGDHPALALQSPAGACGLRRDKSVACGVRQESDDFFVAHKVDGSVELQHAQTRMYCAPDEDGVLRCDIDAQGSDAAQLLPVITENSMCAVTACRRAHNDECPADLQPVPCRGDAPRFCAATKRNGDEIAGCAFVLQD